MAADADKLLAVDEVLSYAQDLVGVFRASNDHCANAQTGAGARMLLSTCRSHSDDLELQMRELWIDEKRGNHCSLWHPQYRPVKEASGMVENLQELLETPCSCVNNIISVKSVQDIFAKLCFNDDRMDHVFFLQSYYVR